MVSLMCSLIHKTIEFPHWEGLWGLLLFSHGWMPKITLKSSELMAITSLEHLVIQPINKDLSVLEPKPTFLVPLTVCILPFSTSQSRKHLLFSFLLRRAPFRCFKKILLLSLSLLLSRLNVSSSTNQSLVAWC